MGASFITEGAIPFAAADPVRVIVSCVVGSSIAGALSMLFQITLPAPHGGLFVIALVNKPVLYILSILIGAVVSALMMGIWKRKLNNTCKGVAFISCSFYYKKEVDNWRMMNFGKRCNEI